MSNPLRKVAIFVLKHTITAMPDVISRNVPIRPTEGIQALRNQGLICAMYDEKL